MLVCSQCFIATLTVLKKRHLRGLTAQSDSRLDEFRTRIVFKIFRSIYPRALISLSLITDPLAVVFVLLLNKFKFLFLHALSTQ